MFARWCRRRRPPAVPRRPLDRVVCNGAAHHLPTCPPPRAVSPCTRVDVVPMSRSTHRQRRVRRTSLPAQSVRISGRSRAQARLHARAGAGARRGRPSISGRQRNDFLGNAVRVRSLLGSGSRWLMRPARAEHALSACGRCARGCAWRRCSARAVRYDASAVAVRARRRAATRGAMAAGGGVPVSVEDRRWSPFGPRVDHSRRRAARTNAS